MFLTVLGDCNAITLEQLTTQYPLSGSLITAFQFLIISLYGIPTHITWTKYGPRFKPHRIPLTPYLVQVALFYLISLLNNAAFSYRIPMSVHIIFRSGGLVISMLLGWLISGKRYTVAQVISVLVVTFGVVSTTLSASNTHSDSMDSSASTYTYVQGISILSLALLLSGFLGLAQDYTYSRYGRPPPGSEKKPAATPTPTWQESMFYLHFLALPMFFLHIPQAYLPLLLNTVTQLLCVAGVHRLTTRVSALTVTLVLVVRKAVSLIISVWLGRGAEVDLRGTIGYSMATGRAKEKEKME
ncbi:UAA transporter family-domain-containing protein [Mycena galericulata]|nr:UAA transporter family-domain-containing protein [Mycena galericulata]